MKLIPIALCVVLAGPAAAQRPMNEMQGDCSNYATKLDREFELWAKPAQPATAVVAARDDAPLIAMDSRHDIRLARHDAVTFATAPEQNRGGPDRFSGIARFTVPASGSYRVSASSGLWVDVVDGGKVIKSSTFEMQTKCTTIFKTVTYRLEAGRQYLLQLNGNRSDRVDLLVTRAP